MSRLTGLSLLGFALAACTRPVPVALQPEEPEPLQVSILPPSMGAGFWVNEPAYVALFDVVPGFGINLLHPSSPRQLTESALPGSSLALGGLSFHPRAYFATQVLDQPHYLVAFASRLPLNIHSTVGYADWITYKLGVTAFAGTALGVFQALFDEVVPVQPADDWAAAVYVVYPGLSWRKNVYQLVRCPDGFVYVMNVEAPVFACPAPRTAPAQTPENDPGGRRKDPNRAVRTGTAIAQVGDGTLPVLRPETDPVRRPPTPVETRGYGYRAYAGSQLSGASYRGSGSGSPGSTGSYSSQTSGNQPTFTPTVTPAPSPASQGAQNGESNATPTRPGGSSKDP